MPLGDQRFLMPHGPGADQPDRILTLVLPCACSKAVQVKRPEVTVADRETRCCRVADSTEMAPNRWSWSSDLDSSAKGACWEAQ